MPTKKQKLPVKTFDVDVHGKQGDDLAFLAVSMKSKAAITMTRGDRARSKVCPAAAFHAWARALEDAARCAYRIAERLEGFDDTEIQADGNFICLTVFSEKAARAMEALAKEEPEIGVSEMEV